MTLRKPRHIFSAPEGDGGGGGGGNFLQSAMSLFHKAPATKPNAVVDTSKYKFDPETGKPIQSNTKDPNIPDPNKSTPNSLDNFKGMFDTTVNTSDQDAVPVFKLDPEKLKTLTGSLDFTSHLTPELQEKLKSGDPQAMQEALNGLGRSAYSRLMEHIPALTEAYVGARMKHANKGLGKSVKSTLTKQSLDKMASDNPVLKRQLETVGEQLLEQFPNATPDWIAEQVPQYFVSIAKLVSPDSFKAEGESKGTQNNPDTSEYDWDSWMAGKKPAATKQ